MWFNLLKLDLASISTQIQGDTEGKNVNIEESKKCREKLLNFVEKLEGLANRHKDVFFDGDGKSKIQEIPELIVCKFVEIIDGKFNSMTSFSEHRVEREIDESARLVDDWHYDFLYFSNPEYMVLLFHLSPNVGTAYYLGRIIIPNEDYLLMYAVKKLWEES